MRISLLIVFLLSNFLSLANRIDELKTESQTDQFVRTLTGDLAIPSEKIDAGLSSIRYLKYDINKDGSTDLLVNNRFIFAIIHISDSAYEINYAGAEYREFRLVDIDTGRSALNLIVRKQNGYGHKFTPVFSQSNDTITYKFHGFIEYRNSPSNINFEYIRISPNSGYRTRPEYEMSIDNKRLANLFVKEVKRLKQTGPHISNLNKKDFEELTSLIRYMDPASLKAEYEVYGSDFPSIDIEIKYNGKIKQIHDYGLTGTLGLIQLYSFIDRLFENQDWIPQTK